MYPMIKITVTDPETGDILDEMESESPIKIHDYVQDEMTELLEAWMEAHSHEQE